MNKRRYIIKSKADLEKIEGYRYDIDPQREPLKKILDHYNVAPMIQCGLSNCHKWHNYGFVVELEKDSIITNVGHVCGAGFGEKFEAERIRYTDSILRPLALQAVRDGKKRLEPIQAKINMLAVAANRLSSRKSEFRKRFPEASKSLDRRASSGNSVVMDSVARSKEEIENSLAANPYQNRENLRFREVEKGRIAGLQLFSFNIREGIGQELVSKAQGLIDLDLDAQMLKTDVLIQWESWLNSFDERFEEAMNFVNKAEEFFNEGNYQLIASIPLPSQESLVLKQIKTASLDEVMTRNELSAIKNKKISRAERRKFQFNSMVR